MKFSQILTCSMAFSVCCFVASAQAEEHVKVVERGDHGKTELRMKVSRHSDGHYYGHYNDHEYVLRGDAVNFTTDGEYYIDGDIDAGNTYVTTRSYRPYVTVVEERHDPIVKIGPVEIRR